MKKPFYKTFYAQILIAVALGLAVGALYPSKAAEKKPVDKTFVKYTILKEWHD